MKELTVQELYDYLSSDEFKNVKSGNIFYNYYIYQYPAKKEYAMRSQIREFQEKLKRPSNYINAMELDLFTVFCDYLKAEKFGPDSLFDSTLEEDKTMPDIVTQELTTEANSDAFIEYVSQRIDEYRAVADGLDKPYVFIHGIGKMFPYLRTNVFLTKYEKYNKPDEYKIILFYPGHQVGNTFSLFDTLTDSHTYRATLLVNK